jgi:hypothetical protein
MPKARRNRPVPELWLDLAEVKSRIPRGLDL